MIKLNNVRLSFNSLDKKIASNQNSNSPHQQESLKYFASFILDKDIHKEEINKIQTTIASLIKLEFNNKFDGYVCLKDGDKTDKKYLENKFTIKATTRSEFTRLLQNKQPIPAEDIAKIFYSGCYVNAAINLKASTFISKMILCDLLGVQFHSHGEPFGGGAIDVTDSFDNISTDDISF